ncbi:MAG: hypothetical protein ACJ8EB_08550 [Allosphingosinicella sp.]
MPRAAGARADVHEEGQFPAFSSWTDRIVLGLLEAGADPRLVGACGVD